MTSEQRTQPGPGTSALLAEVIRGGIVESTHTGTAVAVDASGAVLLAVGDPHRPIFPRSALKPLQALAVLRSGLSLDAELLAVASASHSGEHRHVTVVRRLLDSAGLDESALQNPPALPLGVDAAHALLRRGEGPDRVHHNCSGKHAAFLAAAAKNDWSLHDYLDPSHPLQRLVRQTVERACGQVSAVVPDGCGAPQLRVPLAGLARAIVGLSSASEGSDERQVAVAMAKHPDLVGGTGREVTDLMLALPGLIAKDGAEGVLVAATPDLGVAVKVDDGAQRAAVPAVVALLRAAGLTLDVPEALAAPPVLGGGRRVGEVRTVLAVTPR